MRLAGYGLDDACRTTTTPNERPILERVDGCDDYHCLAADFRYGSWLCENAKTHDGDRRSYSSKTALTVKRASELNLPNDPKNVILAAFQSFAFLHMG